MPNLTIYTPNELYINFLELSDESRDTIRAKLQQTLKNEVSKCQVSKLKQ